MRLKAERLRFMSGLLYVWMSLWVLVVPMVHVHPDADHQHGSGHHSHGGTVHTVFSSDLDCEFEDSHAAGETTGSSSSLIEAAHHPGHDLEHLEVAIVLGSSPKPFGEDGTLLDDAVLSCEHDRSIHVQSGRRTWSPPVRAGTALVTASSPRAPPFV